MNRNPFLLFSLLAGALFFSGVSTTFSATAASPQQATMTKPLPARENPGFLPILVELPTVANTLKLTEAQRKLFAGYRNKYRDEARAILDAHYSTRNEKLAAQEKAEKLAISYDKKTTEALNPSQQKRLREIERQVLGGTLLTAPSEQDFLGLSVLQRHKINALNQESMRRAAMINRKAMRRQLTYHQHILGLRLLRQKYAKAMLKVLTPAQLSQWKASLGELISTAP